MAHKFSVGDAVIVGPAVGAAPPTQGSVFTGTIHDITSSGTQYEVRFDDPQCYHGPNKPVFGYWYDESAISPRYPSGANAPSAASGVTVPSEPITPNKKEIDWFGITKDTVGG
jgi:hypothetical protein